MPGRETLATSPRKPRLTREARAAQKARAERTHDRYVQKTYGLEPGEYARMLEAQDGRCAMCRKLPRSRRLAVDHDHNTGRVRGLLCYSCNHEVLRYLEGDPISAACASQYLADIAASYGPEYDPRIQRE